METKESPYYLGNCECLPTKITFQTSYTTITQELPWDAGADDILQAVYAAMVGMTFSPEGVLEAMRDFAEERLPQQNEEEE